MRTNYTVTGGPHLIRRLKELDQAMARVVRPAVEAGALVFQNRWKELAPFKTGTYRRSIHFLDTAITDTGVEISVGTDLTSPPYPAYLEYGPRPSARPAFDESKGEVEVTIQRALKTIFVAFGG